MQRIIKFRGKRIDNGEWVYGDLWTNLTRPEDPLVRISTWIDNVNYEYTVIPKTAGQYVGQKDKYGQELYEDDVYQTVGCPTRRYKIMYISGAFVGGADEQACNPLGWDEDEVGDFDWMCKIGNIHDNPELLTPSEGGRLNTMTTDPNLKAEGQEEVKAPATETEQEQVPAPTAGEAKEETEG